MGDGFRNKRSVRFSIATLLFAMLCVCGYFSGYRSGYELGLTGGLDARLYAQTYPVADLVVSRNAIGLRRADFQSLIDVIQIHVETESWTVNGAGAGKIQVLASHLSLIVTQSRDVHAEVNHLIEQLRTAQAKSSSH
jgi:hypothetical protein